MEDIRDKHGVVCWGELSTEDPRAAAQFYSKVLGWQPTEEKEMPDGAGTYTCLTTHEGIPVAGVMKPCTEGMPNHWGLFVSVDDVDAAVAEAVAQGGSIVVEAFDYPDAGRMAYLKDPQGATFAVFTKADCAVC